METRFSCFKHWPSSLKDPIPITAYVSWWFQTAFFCKILNSPFSAGLSADLDTLWYIFCHSGCLWLVQSIPAWCQWGQDWHLLTRGGDVPSCQLSRMRYGGYELWACEWFHACASLLLPETRFKSDDLPGAYTLSICGWQALSLQF